MMLSESLLFVPILAFLKFTDVVLALNSEESVSNEALRQVLKQSQECAIVTLELASNTIKVIRTN